MSFNANLDTLYRQVIMDHYKNPRNKGVLNDSIVRGYEQPDMRRPHQTDNEVDGDIVEDAKFEGEGCSISMASASMMTQAIKGKDIETALSMSKIFSDMMQGKEYDDSIDLGDIEALQAFQNSLPVSNVQHCHGKQLKKESRKKKAAIKRIGVKMDG